jgi:hypothetical protein
MKSFSCPWRTSNSHIPAIEQTRDTAPVSRSMTYRPKRVSQWPMPYALPAMISPIPTQPFQSSFSFPLYTKLKMSKRTLDSFFAPPSKKLKPQPSDSNSSTNIRVPFSPGSSGATTNTVALPPPPSLSSPFTHNTHPHPIPPPPPDSLATALSTLPHHRDKEIRNQPDLDLLYYHPFFPRDIAKELFDHLRRELFFYRVRYTIKRFGKETVVNTSRL